MFMIFGLSWIKADDENPTSCLRAVALAAARLGCESSRKFPARTWRGQVRRKTSCLASRLGGHSAALPLPMPGHCREVARLLRGQVASRLASFRCGHGGQVRCKASYLASRLDGRSAALPLPVPGHYREVARQCRETSYRQSCRILRGHRVAISRDSARPSASFWRAAKTLF